jgi:hypothetical protein
MRVSPWSGSGSSRLQELPPGTFFGKKGTAPPVNGKVVAAAIALNSVWQLKDRLPLAGALYLLHPDLKSRVSIWSQ